MYQSIPFKDSHMSKQGLNLHAVFALKKLPKELLEKIKTYIKDINDYRQLILIGHGGKQLWQTVSPVLSQHEHPIDFFSKDSVKRFFAQHFCSVNYQIIYPGTCHIGLQQLGQLAGWHHESPFKVGINAHWGSWFAYRVLLVADSDFAETPPLETTSPCQPCLTKDCIAHCPARALDNHTYDFNKCIDYRKQPQSLCKNRCLARLSCPVAKEHQYTIEQINYHYGLSMRAIQRWYPD